MSRRGGRKKRGKRGGKKTALGPVTLDGRELPALCPHDISVHSACDACGRTEERY